jgi:hypothetical protein
MSRLLSSCLVFLSLSLIPARAQQNSQPAAKSEQQKYSNSTEGLQRLLNEILQAAKAKDAAKESSRSLDTRRFYVVHGCLRSRIRLKSRCRVSTSYSRFRARNKSGL